jgi:predicted HicB family RNase H-like nuclease
VTVPRGHKAQYQEHAEQRGESLNGFIQRAIRETIERDTQDNR